MRSGSGALSTRGTNLIVHNIIVVSHVWHQQSYSPSLKYSQHKFLAGLLIKRYSMVNIVHNIIVVSHVWHQQSYSPSLKYSQHKFLAGLLIKRFSMVNIVHYIIVVSHVWH